MQSLLACENRKSRVALIAVSIVVSCLLAILIDFVVYSFQGPVSSGTWYNKYWILFFAICFFMVSCFFVFRKQIGDKPEKLFFALILVFTMGSSICFDINKVSWDVESHFYFMLSYTDSDFNIDTNQAEYEEIYGYAAQIEESIFDLNAWKSDLNTKSSIDSNYSFEIVPMLTSIYKRIASLPGSLVYVLCGAFGVSFSLKYVLTKLIYAVIYSVVCYRGMRCLESGKMIFAAVSMIPVSLFLAANYSYDYWVNCFLLYAVARLVGELQRPDRLISLKSILLIFGAFIVACGPKAIYFPFAALCLLMPKSKFAKPVHSKIFRVACIIVPLVILSSFLFGFVDGVSTGADTGDSRGGSEVNSTEQVKYVLGHMLEYIFMLANYLVFDYGPKCIKETGMWAYLGFPSWRLWVITFLVLVFVVVTDKDKEDCRALSNWKTRSWSVFLAICTLGLSASALYVSFTAVGADTVAGYQSRYVIPIFISCFFFLGFPKLGKIFRGRNKAIYNGLIMAILAVIPCIELWQTYLCWLT